MTPTPITDVAVTVERIAPQPGDMLVVHTHSRLTSEMHADLMATLRQALPAGVQALVVDAADVVLLGDVRSVEGRPRLGPLTTAAMVHAQSQASRLWRAPVGRADAKQADELLRALDGLARTAGREAVIAHQLAERSA